MREPFKGWEPLEGLGIGIDARALQGLKPLEGHEALIASKDCHRPGKHAVGYINTILAGKGDIALYQVA